MYGRNFSLDNHLSFLFACFRSRCVGHVEVVPQFETTVASLLSQLLIFFAFLRWDLGCHFDSGRHGLQPGGQINRILAIISGSDVDTLLMVDAEPKKLPLLL